MTNSQQKALKMKHLSALQMVQLMEHCLALEMVQLTDDRGHALAMAQ
eukprot:CAMPEP_0196819556 /NCGR_PEP_ID=MMETSP1362-20130617/71089_1 /TAXON_ID=163516 /ORGANISM="Leptocylindrus danicus, Strain CCMP1856" /LENGTH=46 /DNA_ID= /DNA_START= /DNA_END= /DNA_ORIENTATION=